MSNLDIEEEIPKTFDPNHPFLKNRVVILNGFTDQEIFAIMKAVKELCKAGVSGEEPKIAAATGDLIFAKATENSRKAVLGALIVDMSGDHAYLKENPPEAVKKQREERARLAVQNASSPNPSQNTLN